MLVNADEGDDVFNEREKEGGGVGRARHEAIILNVGIALSGIPFPQTHTLRVRERRSDTRTLSLSHAHGTRGTAPSLPRPLYANKTSGAAPVTRLAREGGTRELGGGRKGVKA